MIYYSQQGNQSIAEEAVLSSIENTIYLFSIDPLILDITLKIEIQ
jgi:hypothetical protein|tara:strand:+ start:116 stop:250 length:135 start_codon:yes stop_codon:yes gene_type:complete